MFSNFLVTGGLGFIGSNLVDSLVKRKKSVFVIDDLSSGINDNANTEANYFIEDLRKFISNPEILVDFLNRNEIEVIFHLAANASVAESISNPEKVLEVNSSSSMALLRACQDTKIQRFIFASTSAVYGEPKYLPVDENHSKSPLSPYGQSKLEFEKYLRHHAHDNKIDFNILRLANVYGKRQRPDLEGGVIAIFSDLMKKNQAVKFYGDGKQTRDWVHVDDVVRAFILSAESEVSNEIFSIGTGKRKSLKDLYIFFEDNIKEYMKEPIILKQRDGEIKHMSLNYNSAKEKLGWEPRISFEEGLKTLI
ncbi:GDP-mannose 4,6-dehydratase [Gammaproteobacteria bacterium]|nr:GDP-mannose 4,6-dehydratase [Gammaproteobacteria bacterium]